MRINASMRANILLLVLARKYFVLVVSKYYVVLLQYLLTKTPLFVLGGS